MKTIQFLFNPLLKTFVLLMAICFSTDAAKAQSCQITYSGASCVGEEIAFSCNSINPSSVVWDFNQEGSNALLCDPTFTFNSPGYKVIKLSLKDVNGKTCNSSVTINVKAKPKINIRLISVKRQCYNGNSFCFLDSTKSTQNNTNLKWIKVEFTDGAYYMFYGNGPRTFCHSFSNPSGGTYSMTVTAEDSNACMTSKTYNAIAIVSPSFGLSFTSPQPKRCDSVLLCLSNRSTIPLDSIKSFAWDWGDGQSDAGNKNTPNLWNLNVTNGICHWFKTVGPNKGSFNTTLKVESNSGCRDSFIFNTSATNINNKATIIADYDSVCSSNPVIHFSLKDGPVIQGANPLYIFEQPFTPNHILRAWSGSYKFSSPGVYKVNFSFTHQIPGCGLTVFDTVLVIGPQSIIEAPGMGFIIDSLRSQCVIKDTVKFTNFSKFYHNDSRMQDDDSTYTDNKGFNRPLGHYFTGSNSQVSLKANPQQRGNQNVIRLWDFDDTYCEQCTTDTKNGQNINKNCRYSKDPLPQHWYTPWEQQYDETFSMKPAYISRYNIDSGVYYRMRLWSDDSVAIVRDTFLYYGDNPLALTTKDSIAYLNISNKIMVQKEIRGISKTDLTKPTRFYLQAGDTVYVDPNTGLPPTRFIGPRYLNMQAGQTLVIKTTTDKALYNVWVDYQQDTIPMRLAGSNYKIWKTIRIPAFQNGDSINPAAHRQHFYSGSHVKCYDVKLWQKDIKHPLACASEVHTAISLQPPTAKRLRKSGIQCLGSDNEGFGITFILDDVKAGCTPTWAEINFDTAKNKNAWVPAIGKNLSPGQIGTGGLPPIAPPYGVPVNGYQINGPAPDRYSVQYTKDMIKDTATGFVNIGLIVGNGIWPNGVYPQMCQDTVYYPKFARFPLIDNSFNIVNPQQKGIFNTICKNQPISLATNGWNRTYNEDVKNTVWSFASENSGKYFNQTYALIVTETYDRYVQIHPDTAYLINQLSIVKHHVFDNKFNSTDSQVIRIAKITKWHTEADISNVFDEVKNQLQAAEIDIYQLTPKQLANSMWNGKGTIGKPYSGSRGIIDTTGFGKAIVFSTVADQKQILHYRDTSLLPIDTVKAYNGITYHAYTFTPKHSGMFYANFAINLNTAGTCPKIQGYAKKVSVGFYGHMNYADTILCHSSAVYTSPEFRYFDPYPELTFRLLDPTDYWRDRIAEAGNAYREGYTKTDLSKADDDLNNPKTIFGAWPYSNTGLDNKPNQVLQLGSLSGGIYYNKDTGASYIIRTAASDSMGCRDTFIQEIFTTAVRAKFKTAVSRPQCRSILELFDSSYVMDPHLKKYGKASDIIVKWSVNWGDKGNYAITPFYGTMPAAVGHAYDIPGTYTITLTVFTALGCSHADSVSFTIDGAVPMFDTFIKKEYCKGDTIRFKNTSKYNRKDSNIWVWNFGDNQFASQFDTITAANDTISHVYTTAGTYNVFLYDSYQVSGGKRCQSVFPDTLGGQQAFTVVVKNCDSTGISELRLQDILMYPNPAHNRMTIVSKEKTDIIITDVMGKTIKIFVNEGEQILDLKNLAPGLYIVTTTNRQVIGKLIVE